jgi:hypothetical protein
MDPMLNDRYFLVVKTSDSKTYTVEYKDSQRDSNPGEVFVRNGATRHADMTRAIEFAEDGYIFSEFEKWAKAVKGGAGYNGTIINVTHNQYSFVEG